MIAGRGLAGFESTHHPLQSIDGRLAVSGQLMPGRPLQTIVTPSVGPVIGTRPCTSPRTGSDRLKEAKMSNDFDRGFVVPGLEVSFEKSVLIVFFAVVGSRCSTSPISRSVMRPSSFRVLGSLSVRLVASRPWSLPFSTVTSIRPSRAVAAISVDVTVTSAESCGRLSTLSGLFGSAFSATRNTLSATPLPSSESPRTTSCPAHWPVGSGSSTAAVMPSDSAAAPLPIDRIESWPPATGLISRTTRPDRTCTRLEIVTPFGTTARISSLEIFSASVSLIEGSTEIQTLRPSLRVTATLDRGSISTNSCGIRCCKANRRSPIVLYRSTSKS